MTFHHRRQTSVGPAGRKCVSVAGTRLERINLAISNFESKKPDGWESKRDRLRAAAEEESKIARIHGHDIKPEERNVVDLAHAAELYGYACVYLYSSTVSCLGLAALARRATGGNPRELELANRAVALDMKILNRDCASSNHPSACEELATRYRDGIEVNGDINHAVRLLRSNCAGGDCAALFDLLQKHAVTQAISSLSLKIWPTIESALSKPSEDGTIYWGRSFRNHRINSTCIGNTFSPRPPREVFAHVERSVYLVQTPRGQGSAVAVDRNALLTNCHIVANAANIQLKGSDYEGPALVLFGHAKTDRCVLVVPGDSLFPICTIAPLDEINIGDPVYALGNPQGMYKNFSEGLISGAGPGKESMIWRRTSASISGGSSGGALFDNRGRPVGITTAIHEEARNIGFAIPAQACWEK